MMHANLCSIPLALAIAVAGFPLLAQAGPAATKQEVVPEESRRVMLEIDALNMEKESSTYEGMVLYAITNALTARGFQVVEDNADEIIGITLSWENYEDSVFGVEWSVVTRHGAMRRLPVAICDRCNDNDFVASIEARLDEAIALLDDVEDKSDPGTKGAVGPAAETDGAGQDERLGKRRGLAPMAGVGIGVAVAGAIGIVTGAVFFGRGEKTEAGPGADDVDRTNYRPPGIGLMAGGGAFVVVGAVLIAVGQVRHNKRARSEKATSIFNARRITWQPRVTRDGAGFGISGRF